MTLTGPLFSKDFYHMILKVNPMGELQFQKWIKETNLDLT